MFMLLGPRDITPMKTEELRPHARSRLLKGMALVGRLYCPSVQLKDHQCKGMRANLGNHALRWHANASHVEKVNGLDRQALQLPALSPDSMARCKA